MIVLSDEEIASGVVFVKSDVYPMESGRFAWVARHGSGWAAGGTGGSHEDCVRQVNEQLAAELVAGGYVADASEARPEATILRDLVGTPPNERVTRIRAFLGEPS